MKGIVERRGRKTCKKKMRNGRSKGKNERKKEWRKEKEEIK